jgi:hypothetical protein
MTEPTNTVHAATDPNSVEASVVATAPALPRNCAGLLRSNLRNAAAAGRPGKPLRLCPGANRTTVPAHLSGERIRAGHYRLRSVFLAATVPTRPKLRLPSAKQSESQRNRSRFHWRHARKQATQNIDAKKRARQEGVSPTSFGNAQYPKIVRREI